MTFFRSVISLASLVCVCVFVTVTKCEGFFDFFTSILFFLQKQKTQGHVSGAHFFECFLPFFECFGHFLECLDRCLSVMSSVDDDCDCDCDQM